MSHLSLMIFYPSRNPLVIASTSGCGGNEQQPSRGRTPIGSRLWRTAPGLAAEPPCPVLVAVVDGLDRRRRQQAPGLAVTRTGPCPPSMLGRGGGEREPFQQTTAVGPRLGRMRSRPCSGAAASGCGGGWTAFVARGESAPSHVLHPRPVVVAMDSVSHKGGPVLADHNTVILQPHGQFPQGISVVPSATAPPLSSLLH